MIRGVLSPDEVAAANRSIDAHVDELEGFESTQDMLGWSMEERRPFQQLLAHPRIVPYLNEICGRGFRMVCRHSHADDCNQLSLALSVCRALQACEARFSATVTVRTGPFPNSA